MMLCPNDADYDDMHHALGRPKRFKPGDETYRNYYCIGKNTTTAKRFRALGWWTLACMINDGRDAIYSVNGAGKQALAEWLLRRAQSGAQAQGIADG